MHRHTLGNPLIRESETEGGLEALNPNKGAGPDGLPPKSLMTGATPSLPQLQKHPAQLTQTYSTHQPDVCLLQSG